MKVVFTVSFIIILSMFYGSLAAQEDYLIFKSKTGKAVTVQQMAKQLAKQHVIFFGEYHDDAICHKLEMELLIELYKLNPNIIVSFEMFERDVQGVLNDYLTGKVDELKFLSESRPWPNYPTDYKPMLEFAKAYKLPVLAANVPRKYAGMVAKDGADALNGLPDDRKTEFAKELKIRNDRYKDEFMKTMQQNMGHGMPGMYENIYAAQCLKDDTMAESIKRCLKSIWKDGVIIHYNGDFHSRYKLGTAQKLKLMVPETQIAVISPAYVDPQAPLLWDKNLKQDADYIIMIHKPADQPATNDTMSPME